MAFTIFPKKPKIMARDVHSPSGRRRQGNPAACVFLAHATPKFPQPSGRRAWQLSIPQLQAAADALPMNLVVRTDDGVVSLLVDEIGEVVEVVEVDEDSFERPPPTLKGVARELVRGVYKQEGNLLLVLDTAKAVSVTRS